MTDKSEYVTIELNTFIKDWENELIKKKDQRFCSKFLEEYDGLCLYYNNLKKRYIIDHEYI